MSITGRHPPVAGPARAISGRARKTAPSAAESPLRFGLLCGIMISMARTGGCGTPARERLVGARRARHRRRAAQHKDQSMRTKPVHWFEGMLLLPHHLQAAQDHFLECLRTAHDWLSAYDYGLHKATYLDWQLYLSREPY